MSSYLRDTTLVKGDEESKFRRILSEKISSKNFIDVLRNDGVEIITDEEKKSNKTTLKRAVVTVLLST